MQPSFVKQLYVPQNHDHNSSTFNSFVSQLYNPNAENTTKLRKLLSLLEQHQFDQNQIQHIRNKIDRPSQFDTMQPKNMLSLIRLLECIVYKIQHCMDSQSQDLKMARHTFQFGVTLNLCILGMIENLDRFLWMISESNSLRAKIFNIKVNAIQQAAGQFLVDNRQLLIVDNPNTINGMETHYISRLISNIAQSHGLHPPTVNHYTIPNEQRLLQMWKQRADTLLDYQRFFNTYYLDIWESIFNCNFDNPRLIRLYRNYQGDTALRQEHVEPNNVKSTRVACIQIIHNKENDKHVTIRSTTIEDSLQPTESMTVELSNLGANLDDTQTPSAPAQALERCISHPQFPQYLSSAIIEDYLLNGESQLPSLFDANSRTYQETTSQLVKLLDLSKEDEDIATTMQSLQGPSQFAPTGLFKYRISEQTKRMIVGKCIHAQARALNLSSDEIAFFKPFAEDFDRLHAFRTQKYYISEQTKRRLAGKRIDVQAEILNLSSDETKAFRRLTDDTTRLHALLRRTEPSSEVYEYIEDGGIKKHRFREDSQIPHLIQKYGLTQWHRACCIERSIEYDHHVAATLDGPDNDYKSMIMAEQIITNATSITLQRLRAVNNTSALATAIAQYAKHHSLPLTPTIKTLYEHFEKYNTPNICLLLTRLAPNYKLKSFTKALKPKENCPLSTDLSESLLVLLQLFLERKEYHDATSLLEIWTDLHEKTSYNVRRISAPNPLSVFVSFLLTKDLNLLDERNWRLLHTLDTFITNEDCMRKRLIDTKSTRHHSLYNSETDYLIPLNPNTPCTLVYYIALHYRLFCMTGQHVKASSALFLISRITELAEADIYLGPGEQRSLTGPNVLTILEESPIPLTKYLIENNIKSLDYDDCLRVENRKKAWLRSQIDINSVDREINTCEDSYKQSDAIKNPTSSYYFFAIRKASFVTALILLLKLVLTPIIGPIVWILQRVSHRILYHTTQYNELVKLCRAEKNQLQGAKNNYLDSTISYTEFKYAIKRIIEGLKEQQSSVYLNTAPKPVASSEYSSPNKKQSTHKQPQSRRLSFFRPNLSWLFGSANPKR